MWLILVFIFFIGKSDAVWPKVMNIILLFSLSRIVFVCLFKAGHSKGLEFIFKISKGQTFL